MNKTIDSTLTEYIKAYSALRDAMTLSDFIEHYHKVHLRSKDVYDVNFYNIANPQNDLPLCCIIRSILLDQVPELYQILK